MYFKGRFCKGDKASNRKLWRDLNLLMSNFHSLGISIIHHSCRSYATKNAVISSTILLRHSMYLAVMPEMSTSWYQYQLSLDFY